MLDSGSKRTETYTILRASLSTTGAESPSVRLSRCSPLSLAKTIFWAGYCVINCKLVGLLFVSNMDIQQSKYEKALAPPKTKLFKIKYHDS